METNPLLKPSGLTHNAPAFDTIKDEDILSAFMAALKNYHAGIQAIAENPEPPSFQNTIYALEKAIKAVMQPLYLACTLELVARTAAREEAADKIQAIWAGADGLNTIFMNEAILSRIQHVYKHKQALGREEHELVNFYHMKSLNSGSGLSVDSSRSLCELSSELKVREETFRRADEEAREDRALAILEMRQRQANLLGYNSWAEKQAAENAFLSLSDFEDLAVTLGKNLASTFKEPPRTPISYYRNDPHFELENVLQNGIFYMAEQLYGVTFIKRDDLPVYHESVSAYEAKDANGKSLAILYVDLFARQGKRGGAFHTTITPMFLAEGQRTINLVSCDFEKPACENVTLLSPSNLSSLFHEFGHALHQISSRTKYLSNAGTNVACDYVEFPSQLHEFWGTHPEVLANYARHHETGEPMPSGQFKSLQACMAQSEQAEILRYLKLSVLDVALHRKDAHLEDLKVLQSQALAACNIADAGCYVSEQPGIFSLSRYSSRFYSYLWGRVLAGNVYQHMLENGGFCRKTGQKFWDDVLCLGSSKAPAEALENYLGHEPTLQPFLDLLEL